MVDTGDWLEADRALRVLVVDDNRDSADSMALLVDLWGHETRVAYEGASALETAGRFRPEVFLLDIGMPRMDGYELARRIRDHPDLKAAKLLALSGYADPCHRAASERAGFDYYLVKPVAPEMLEQLLSALLRLRTLASELTRQAQYQARQFAETSRLLAENRRQLDVLQDILTGRRRLA